MPISLRPMSPDQLPLWLEACAAEYIESQIAAGRTRADAERNAATSFDSSFPGGAPAPGHAVFDVLDEKGEAVGYLWIGTDTSDDASAWWVWNIEIDAGKRGRGYGRAAMLLGETYARQQGATTLGLNVFGSNTVARGLYEALGYETTALQMRKPLT